MSYQSIPIGEDRRKGANEKPLARNKRNAKELWSLLSNNLDLALESFSSRTDATAIQIRSDTISSGSNNNDGDDESKILVQKTLMTEEKQREIGNLLLKGGRRAFLIEAVLYLICAVVAFSFVFEKWSIIDSLYFAVVTFSTIGYGSLVPTTPNGQLFTSIFALGGVTTLGIVIGFIGSNIIETQIESAQHAHLVSEATKLDLFEVPQNYNSKRSKSKKIYSVHDDSSSQNSNDNSRKIRNSFRVKTTINRWDELRIAATAFVILLTCSAILGYSQRWSYIETMYFSVITATTIGFGDYEPTKPSDRLVALFVIPIMVACLGTLLSQAASTIIEHRQGVYRRDLFDKLTFTVGDLEAMSSSYFKTVDDCEVTREDYVTFMLLAMKKVDVELINELKGQFEELDVTKTGTLSRHDLILTAKKKLQCPKRKLQLAKYKEQLLSVADSARRRREDAAVTKCAKFRDNYEIWRMIQEEYEAEKDDKSVNHDAEISTTRSLPPRVNLPPILSSKNETVMRSAFSVRSSN